MMRIRMSYGVSIFTGIVLAGLALNGVCAVKPPAAGVPPPVPSRSWVDLSRYSGRSDIATVTQGDYRQLLYELQTQRSVSGPVALSTAKRRPYDTVATPRNNLRERVPLSVVHWNRAVESVSDEQRLQALENGIEPEPDVRNVTVFAFSPVRPKTYRGAELYFSVDSGDFFEETGAAGSPVVSLRLDANDGQGFRDLEPGRGFAASYGETGLKAIRMEATLADGSLLSASAQLEVMALAPPYPTETVDLVEGKLYVYKSGNHAGLRCPVLVVEGFDMDNNMDWDELYDSLNKQQLAETLRSHGRDLVVLDFQDATADILSSNAFVAMDAINYVNSMRSDMADKFTLIGASMGGLVTRFALSLMERYPDSYGQSQVDTWISFDSPQEGANIPLGLQQFFDFFGDVSKKSSEYSDLAVAEDYRKKVDRPAAQQMLLCHHLTASQLAAPSPKYISFYTTLRSYGYPTSCKKIAISNGSKYGLKQPFLPGEMVVKWYYRSLKVDIDGHVFSLQKSLSEPVKVFYGWFNPWDLFADIHYQSSPVKYYPYALDNAAGGTRASFRELYDKLPSAYKDAGSYCNYDSHCFIPTTSALGIPKEHMETSLYANPDVAALSPFDETHCAISNEGHIEINARNKDWFIKAVLEGYDTDGDGMDDWQEYLAGTAYDGPSLFAFHGGDALTVDEGSFGSGGSTHAANIPVFGSGPASVDVYVLPGTATESDYWFSSGPVTLHWAAGERGVKYVTVPIDGDTSAEGDEVFYLALGGASGNEIGEPRLCAVTIVDDDPGTVSYRGVFVAGLPYPPEGGKVSGSAYAAPGSSVRLDASPMSGWTFLHWDDGSQVAARTVHYGEAAAGAQDGVADCKAIFKRTEDLAPPSASNLGPQTATVGIAFVLPLHVDSECLPELRVSGLPAGIKLDAGNGCISGVTSRAGIYTVTFAASNPKGSTAPMSFTVRVDPLPGWAQGSFAGYGRLHDSTPCMISMTVTARGKSTGKVLASGTNYVFSASSLSSGGDGDRLSISAVAKAGRAAMPLSLSLSRSSCIYDGAVAVQVSIAQGACGTGGYVTMYRSVWKDAGMAAVSDFYDGYYTSILPGNAEYGSGYLTFTVDKVGKVKVGGKLADGTAVSLSGTLILDDIGRVFAVVYSAPAVYKGGCLFGQAELVAPPEGGKAFLRLLDNVSFLWLSWNPQATGEYGKGFSRELGITGGWYSKTGNLYDYYVGRNLSVGVDAAAYAPELTVGTTRYDSIWWNPTGIALAPTIKSGVMVGLSAPPAGKPVDPDKNGVWDYSDTNSVGLKVSLARPTGIFKGSFNAWFDYPEKKHVSKSLIFEGALTPARENPDDGVAGRGFFLWPDKSITPAYAFKWSYDFKILMTE